MDLWSVRAIIQRHMLRDPRLSRSARPKVLLWAAVLGGVSGAAATAVRLAFVGVQWLFTQSRATLPDAAAALPNWRRALTPVLGAALATLVLRLRSRPAARLGREPRPFVDYVEAIRNEHGRIPLVPNLWRTGASAFSIATGAAVGREGSMIQFASAVTSVVERRLCGRWPALDALPAPLAVACGVAGGVATSYQAPIAAAFFAMEIALGSVRLEAAVPVALASAAGWLVSRSILRPAPLYPLSGSGHIPFTTILLLAAVAVLMGCAGPLYQKTVRGLAWLDKLPFPLVLGGLVVGVISVWQPRVWGNGDAGLNLALGLPSLEVTAVSLHLLMGVLALRLVATSVCVGAGTVGGVFTPTLFAGAAIASCMVQLLHVPQPTGAVFALVGMGSLIAAATHAPLMATFMTVELTGEWRLLPILLATNLIAWRVAKRLSPLALYAIATDQPKQVETAPNDGKATSR